MAWRNLPRFVAFRARGPLFAPATLALPPSTRRASLRRIVLMGQGGVGKTAMVLRYTTGDFNEQVRRRGGPRWHQRQRRRRRRHSV